MFIAIIVLISLLLALWFMIGSGKSAEKIIPKAKELENEKKYKEACYTYATAVLGGALPRAELINKIKSLWDQFGPFDYSDIEKTYEQHDTKEGCGAAGHVATMSIIEEAVTGQKRRFIVTKDSIKLK